MKTKISIALVISLLPFCCKAQQEYEPLIENGLQAAKESKYDEAEHLFKEAIQVSPSDYRNALVYMNLGKMQELQGNNQEALNSYTEAIKQYPENTRFISSRAELYLKLENYAKAVSDYSEIIRLTPGDMDAYAYRGYAYCKMKDLDKAKADLTLVLSKVPTNYMASLGMVIIEQQMRHEANALAQANILISKFPKMAEPYFIRAELETDAGQKELAVIDLDKAIELDSSNKNYVLKRARLYLDLGKKHLARRDLEKAMELGVPRVLLSDDLNKCE